MRTPKQVLRPERLRLVPEQFSWVDQALVRHGLIDRMAPRAAALYLFLVTVADAQGLSYYGQATLARPASPERTGAHCGARRTRCAGPHRLPGAAVPGAVAEGCPATQTAGREHNTNAIGTATTTTTHKRRPPEPGPTHRAGASPCSTMETFCRIKDHLGRQRLSVAQTARALGLDVRTVSKWADEQPFHPRKAVVRPSKLDAHKGQIVRWLDVHPYSAQQIYQRLREIGFDGGLTIVKDYVHRIRPRAPAAFLKLDFEPGEAAQVDWGEWGTIAVGSTRRRLSFFVMVLCHSRRMYLEFTVSQTMEFFLQCHENAFAAFGGVSRRVMVDNLLSAVLQRLVGQAPVFNPKYLDFSRHWGFDISPCNVRAGNEKGRVENGVGYVKKNFLAGLELGDFSAMQPAAQLWVDTVADVRIHESTHRRPIDRFKEEAAKLRPLNPAGFDLARPIVVRATKQFRVALDSNHY